LKIILRASFEPHHGAVHPADGTSIESQPAGGRQFKSQPAGHTERYETTVASTLILNQAVRRYS
jgi:hypothetical protein